MCPISPAAATILRASSTRPASASRDYRDEGLTPLVLHLGDHDPNGLDMTRDNRDRLALFARGDVEVRRIALNLDQVELYRPPPNPAKETDTRYASIREAVRDRVLGA